MAFNPDTLDAAITEARRFLDRAEQLRSVSIDEPRLLYGSNLSARVRRASLDLTKALADLRRPPNAC